MKNIFHWPNNTWGTGLKNGKFTICGDLIPGLTNIYWTCTMSISRGWVRASRQAVQFVGKTRAYSRKGCLVRLTEDRLGDRVNHKIPASRARRQTSFFLLPAPVRRCPISSYVLAYRTNRFTARRYEYFPYNWPITTYYNYVNSVNLYSLQ